MIAVMYRFVRMGRELGGGLIVDTCFVIRHALHDAEHHAPDVRRGVAQLLLAGRP